MSSYVATVKFSAGGTGNSEEFTDGVVSVLRLLASVDADVGVRFHERDRGASADAGPPLTPRGAHAAAIRAAAEAALCIPVHGRGRGPTVAQVEARSLRELGRSRLKPAVSSWAGRETLLAASPMPGALWCLEGAGEAAAAPAVAVTGKVRSAREVAAGQTWQRQLPRPLGHAGAASAPALGFLTPVKGETGRQAVVWRGFSAPKRGSVVGDAASAASASAMHADAASAVSASGVRRRAAARSVERRNSRRGSRVPELPRRNSRASSGSPPPPPAAGSRVVAPRAVKRSPQPAAATAAAAAAAAAAEAAAPGTVEPAGPDSEAAPPVASDDVAPEVLIPPVSEDGGSSVGTASPRAQTVPRLPALRHGGAGPPPSCECHRAREFAALANSTHRLILFCGG
jgi:hypothetical protein